MLLERGCYAVQWGSCARWWARRRLLCRKSKKDKTCSFANWRPSKPSFGITRR